MEAEAKREDFIDRNPGAGLDSTEFGSTNPSPTEFGSTNSSPTEFGSTNPSPTEFGSTNTSPTEFGSTNPSPTEFGSTNNHLSPAASDHAASTESRVTGLILYDGVCGLCNRFVRTVLDRDPEGRFQFAALQSEIGQSLLTSMGNDPSALKSIYLIKGYGKGKTEVLTKAKAALEIFGQLKGPIRLLKVFSILPAWLLNYGYDLVAANRYRIFGRLDACPLPNPKHLERFLDQ
jgi:predicted DCC family thiol-disulfide oxidoreductase YuxK